jgi:copper homeostasis protein
LLEVIVTNVKDAVNAENGGADRLELITAYMEGGLTPSIGTIEEVVQAVRIPVYVMVRPHSRSFSYDESDIRVMKKDIHAIKLAGAAGVVIGALTSDKKVDVRTLELLLEEAEGLGVTFHRAIDESRNLCEAFETLLSYPQIERVLTSGGKDSAMDAVEEICRLVEASRNTRLSVMAGSGLNQRLLTVFIDKTGVAEVHFGRGARIHDEIFGEIDVEKIREIKQCLNPMRI